MSKKVYVTSAQKAAAKAAVKRSESTGKPISGAVRKIAAAKTAPAKKAG